VRPTRRRTPRFALIAAGVGVVASTLFAGAAVAKKTDPADVEQAFHKAEVTNEQVNSIGVRIDATHQEISDLNADIAAQNKRYQKQKEKLSALIVQQHLDAPLGPTVNLLGSKDPGKFLDGLGAVEALNSQQAEQLEKFDAAGDELRARRSQLEDRQKSLKDDEAHITDRRAEVQAQYKAAKKLFSQLSTREQAKFMDSDTDLNFEVEAFGATKRAIDFAIAQLGDPYVYGGTGPNGWDCSGLVMKAFAAAGISLPRVVGPQMSASRHVSMDSLQPGDLVAYGDMSHIGIYLGHGKVIHAPHPGRSVEITGLAHFSVAGRVG
jgi:cell wall-associated NlpC family hydrolase